MDSALIPCPACDRHVRTTEGTCPFCAAPLPDDLARRAVPPAPHRLGRAAAFAFGASVALAGGALATCSNEVLTEAAAGGTSGGGLGGGGGDGGAVTGEGGGIPVPLYGGPFPMDDGGHDGGIVPPYGSPAPYGL